MPESTPKKKLPVGVKIIIGVVGAFVILGFLFSIGMTLIGGLFSSKGEKLAEKGLEKWIEHQAAT